MPIKKIDTQRHKMSDISQSRILEFVSNKITFADRTEILE